MDQQQQTINRPPRQTPDRHIQTTLYAPYIGSGAACRKKGGPSMLTRRSLRLNVSLSLGSNLIATPDIFCGMVNKAVGYSQRGASLSHHSRTPLCQLPCPSRSYSVLPHSATHTTLFYPVLPHLVTHNRVVALDLVVTTTAAATVAVPITATVPPHHSPIAINSNTQALSGHRVMHAPALPPTSLLAATLTPSTAAAVSHGLPTLQEG